MKIIKWGIVGPGKIAREFAEDLALVDGCELVAVASSNEQRALDFASEFNLDRHYSNYEDFFTDGEVDIVYVATVHPSHKQLSIEAMNHGKHVLCEKPLAINAAEVNAMIEAAKANNVFLMEAFWSRFNPSISEVLSRVRNGDLGEVSYVNADFSFHRIDSPNSRLLNMDLAGGALLDMGVYPLFLAYSVFGMPEEIVAMAHKHETGADIQTALLLKYNKGIANLMTGFTAQSDMVAKICGDKATILLQPIWHKTQSYQFFKVDSSEIETIKKPTLGKGFSHEIMECNNCIRNGHKQSESWSWQNSLDLITICDQVREQINLKYPTE